MRVFRMAVAACIVALFMIAVAARETRTTAAAAPSIDVATLLDQLAGTVAPPALAAPRVACNEGINIVWNNPTNQCKTDAQCNTYCTNQGCGSGHKDTCDESGGTTSCHCHAIE